MRYEDYVANAKEVLKSLCDFLEVRFEEKMLQGNGVQLPKFTQYQHAKTRGPADSGGSQRWETLLSKREISLIDNQCYDWMLHYGYLKGEKGRLQLRYYHKLLYLIKSGLVQFRSKLTVLFQNRAH